MKKISWILICSLVTACFLPACCYAPGVKGKLDGDRLYGTVPTIDSQYDALPAVTTPATIETTPEAAPIYTPVDLPPEKDDVFVDVQKYIPDVRVDLRYASMNNFTGGVVYYFAKAYLRYGTVAKLMDVQEELRKEGLSLKIWDAFRPASAQGKLWAAKPDPVYVANPLTGYSAHTRGNTVDVTLVNANGTELAMPSDFDAFSALGDRDYTDCSEEVRENAQLLERVMSEHGFKGYDGEWWHYTDTTDYAIDMYFDPSAISTWYASCNEYINIRSKPDVMADSLGQIRTGQQMTLLGWADRMAYIKFNDIYGFVNSDYIRRVE